MTTMDKLEARYDQWCREPGVNDGPFRCSEIDWIFERVKLLERKLDAASHWVVENLEYRDREIFEEFMKGTK